MTQMMEAPGGPGSESPWTPAPPRPAPPRSRPGWSGVVAISAGAAVLSSLLTAGAVGAFGDTGTPVASSAPAAVTAQSGQAAAPLVTGTSTAPNWVAVGSAVEPSVVSVRVEGANGSGGEGSGVVLDTAGRVLTNNHVVADGGGGSIAVVLSDGRTYPATLVGADPSTDLAVIAVTKPPKGMKPATFGDSAAVKVGDPVMAVGNPLGLADTVTTGIVSALNRPVSTSASTPLQQGFPFGAGQAQTEQVVTNAIQTDAAINPGNSGGALVDAGGRVIGITSTIASLGVSGASQAGSIGLGFAIPSNEAKDVARQLIATGSVQHAYLGVTLADGTVTLDGADRQAAVIGAITAGAPAAKAGLRAGDAITEINGAAVDGADSLVGRIRAVAPGTKVSLTVVRGGKAQTVDATLAARPAAGNG
jgi:putative serine protease PepD